MTRVVALFLALALAAGCAGERPTLDEGAAREVDGDVGTPDGAGDAGDGGSVVLRLAVPAARSDDPADAGPASLTARVLADLRYEGLARLATDGRPEPALADRWFVSEDRRTWTFVLPDDLADAAGDRLTARDVKRSLERVAARGAADQAATALTAVTGWDDAMFGRSGGVAGIVVPDATTLVIQLDRVFELLPDVLASPAFGVTGLDDEGRFRITGAFAPTAADPDVLVARSTDGPVGRVELVRTDTASGATVRDGVADWAVLAPDRPATGLPANVIRQPLDLEVAIAVRLADPDERRALLPLMEPLLLAPEVDGLTARTVTRAPAEVPPPDAVTVDIPTGRLAPIAEALAGQLEGAGMQVTVERSDPAAFAERVATGEAEVFPVIVAGGVGPEGGVLRLAVPGATDDVFGTESPVRAELAAAIEGELDVEQRVLFGDALERALVDEGLLLPIGQFEVRVAVSRELTGLRHRIDGTLDLSDVAAAPGD